MLPKSPNTDLGRQIPRLQKLRTLHEPGQIENGKSLPSLKSLIALTTALLSATALAGTIATAEVRNADALDPNQTIVENAQKVSNFSTLVSAVQAAGLADDLMGPGPYTVFAPVDAAFAALPDGTLDSLLADIPALTNVLLYHVVPGKVMAADVVNLDSADTAAGIPVDIMVGEDGSVMVGNATVVTTSPPILVT